MRSLLRSFLLALLTAAVATLPAHADHDDREFCDTGIPADEELGFTAFPRGEVFCSLIADPKADGSFVSYVRGSASTVLGTDLGSIGVGDRLGLFRVNGPTIGEGVQMSLTGNVYAQFDLNSSSFELLNADYLLSLPLTLRRGNFSSRLRVYHQSSHLGDRLVLLSTAKLENFAYEAVEGLVSFDAGPFRTYGGGEYLFSRRPDEIVSSVIHGGAEFRQPGALVGGDPYLRVRFVAGLDVKTSDELDWSIAWSGRAGFEVGRPSTAHHRSRQWSILGEYYDGPSPYGQFFRDPVKYYGIGLHVGI